MSISLSLLSINSQSPYRVESVNGYSFTFHTRYGHTYEAGFTEDYMLSDDGLVFQFFLSCTDNESPEKDEQVMKTVVAILEEFFKNELVCLVYICDTHDGRQAVRQRLFASWFYDYAFHSRYEFSYKDIIVDEKPYYVSLICAKNNPLLEDREAALEGLCQRIAGK
jgi:hypothetical protein